MLAKRVGYHRQLLALCAIALTAFFFIILANSVQASDSVNGSLNQTLMTKEDAAQMMIATVAADINDSSFAAIGDGTADLPGAGVVADGKQ